MIWVVLVGFGLIFGGFVNALVWRLHAGEDWVRGRSHCTHCQHILAAKDLVPVLSWVWLRGKCRYCHKKIDDSPFVELLLPALFVLSYAFWPVMLQNWGLVEFVVWLGFLVGFVALTVYDLRWYLLPNRIVFPLIVLALAQVVAAAIYNQDWSILVNAGLGALVIAGLFYVLFQLSQGRWIGGGDVKLAVVLGLLAGGLIEAFLLLMVASVAGLLASIPLLLRGRLHRKTQLPFGPFLILGVVIVKLFGASIIAWYAGLMYV